MSSSTANTTVPMISVNTATLLTLAATCTLMMLITAGRIMMMIATARVRCGVAVTPNSLISSGAATSRMIAPPPTVMYISPANPTNQP